MKHIPFLDSHTGGEPTRLLYEQLPPLQGSSVAQKAQDFATRFDSFRTQTLNEPRGSDVLVGALLLPPSDPTCALGVIYFNNVGYLGMCGHGTIGLLTSLAYLGRITPGAYRVETPVGIVEATLHPAPGSPYPNRVSVRNIPAYRWLKNVRVQMQGREIHGDVAWGGNWFFLCHEHGLEVSPANREALTEFAWALREAYTRQGLLAPDGHEIDHVELFAASEQADSRSFVLCPGKAYDRSPCGTGTSAALSCLAEEGLLREGQVWRQQSVIGSVFEGRVERQGQEWIPTITGEAWVMAEGQLLVDERDPFGAGIPAE